MDGHSSKHSAQCGDPAKLWREVGIGFERLFRAAAGFKSWTTPSATLAVSGVCVADLNCGVIDAGDAAPDVVLVMAEHLRQQRLPGLLLVTDAAGRKASAAAESAGLVLAGRMPLMSMAAGVLGPELTHFTVRRVTDAADLSAANRVMAAAFDLSYDRVQEPFSPRILTAIDVRVELVLDGDQPVGALQSTTAEHMTGIWSMATLPAHRRRGIARAGLLHALASRFAEGCEVAFLVATADGQPLYEDVGFGVVAWCNVWLVDPRLSRN